MTAEPTIGLIAHGTSKMALPTYCVEKIVIFGNASKFSDQLRINLLI
jgi:hypothetical protein